VVLRFSTLLFNQPFHFGFEQEETEETGIKGFSVPHQSHVGFHDVAAADDADAKRFCEARRGKMPNEVRGMSACTILTALGCANTCLI
jgi:hypothetical protein